MRPDKLLAGFRESASLPLPSAAQREGGGFRDVIFEPFDRSEALYIFSCVEADNSIDDEVDLRFEINTHMTSKQSKASVSTLFHKTSNGADDILHESARRGRQHIHYLAGLAQSVPSTAELVKASPVLHGAQTVKPRQISEPVDII